MRHLLLIGSAALILAAITAQWMAGLPAAARASTAGVRLDEPPPWSNKEPGGVVSVAMGGPAARSGLRKGDLVQAINGVPAWSSHALHRLLDNSRAGESLEYTVLHGSQTRVAPLRLESRLGRIWVDLLCNVFAAGIFFGVAVFVYWKHPKDRRALTFFLMCLPFALLFSLSSLLAVRQGDFVTPPALWYGMLMASRLLLLSPLLHLPLIFPKSRPLVEKYPGIVGWVYAPSALIAVWMVVLTLLGSSLQVNPNALFALNPSIGEAIRELGQGSLLVTVALAIGLLAPAAFLFWKSVRSVYKKGWRSVLVSRPGLFVSSLFFTPLLLGLALVPLSAMFPSPRPFWLGVLIAAGIALVLELIGALLAQLIIPVAACVSLFRNYRDAGIAEKQQLRWPLWGTVTAVAGFVLSFVTLRVLDPLGPGSIGVGWFARALADRLPTIFLLLIPISFAFAIARYRVMDDFPAEGTALADSHVAAASV